MNWLELEKTELEANNDISKINWLKWEDKAVKSIEIDFRDPFIKEKDGYDKLQVRIPVKEGNELKCWGVYPSNPIYKELINAGLQGKKNFKILMQKMKTNKGLPGNAFTILETS